MGILDIFNSNAADKILINCKIYSVDGNDNRLTGDMIVIRKDKIIFAGSGKTVEEFAGKNTEIIDCEGNTVLPGLCDAHCHPASAATYLCSCPLFDIGVSPEEENFRQKAIDGYMAKLKQYADEHPNEKVIKGFGWDYAYFKAGEDTIKMPTRHDIDKVCSDRPVVLISYCGHYWWANTKAIEGAGLTNNLPEVTSGIIYTEEDGYPEGVFQEAGAYNLIMENLENADFTVEQYKDAIRAYQQNFGNRYGITMVQDCGGTLNANLAYLEMSRKKELTMRVRGVYVIDGATPERDYQGMIDTRKAVKGNDLFDINTAKFFMESGFVIDHQDGMPDIPDEFQGILNFDLDSAAEYMRKCMEAGLQIHCHAMGDGSVKLAVDAIEAARAGQKIGPGRDAIAHLMLIPPGYIEKIAKLDILCSCQPLWAVWNKELEDFIIPGFGEERALGQYPIKRFMDEGSVIAYGSDFPYGSDFTVLPPNPFYAMQCAMTRSVFKLHPDYEACKGKQMGFPQAPDVDCVTLKEAIKSSTYNGAYEMFIENITGSIEEGKSADLAILNCDIESIDTEDICAIEVKKTIFKGKVVYEA